MNRSWTHFRRALLALSFLGAMGFGATQGLAAPAQAMLRACSPYSGPTFDPECDQACQVKGYDYGFCRYGQCVCRNVTPP